AGQRRRQDGQEGTAVAASPQTRVEVGMKRRLLLSAGALALVTSTTTLPAQEPAPPAAGAVLTAQQGPPQSVAELRQKRAEKLALPVFKNAAWLFDYDAARARAKQEGKLLLVYFTRSYAPCNPCDKLEERVLATDEFAQWSKQVVLYLHITASGP